MKANLTERYIKSVKPSDKAYDVYDQVLGGLILRVEKSGVISFYVRYYNKEGKNNRTWLGHYGKITLTQAKELAKQYLGAISSGIDPQHQKKMVKAEAKKAKQDAITLKEFIDDVYTPWVKTNRKSGSHTLMLLDRYFSHWYSQEMMSFTRQQIEQWQIKQRERGLKPSAVNRPLNALKSVFTRAHELDLIKLNILRPVKKLQECKDIRVRYLKPDEGGRLKSVLDERNQEQIKKRLSANQWRKERGYPLLFEYMPHHYADHLTPIILLAMNTGMRRGELLQLCWTDIDFEQRQLTIRAETAKSSKTRRIPLNDPAYQVLSAWKETNFVEKGLVFSSEGGEALTTIKTSWRGLMKKALIEDFRFHDLRHNFASQLVMKGVDLNLVRELLGHSDYATTLRYAHVADSNKAEALALLI